VDLNLAVDQGQWGFVTPSYTDYAYLDGDSLQDSVFAVLCMTGSRTGEQLPEQVSASAIPRGSVAGFVISQARALDDLVRPAMKLAYLRLTDANFLLNSDETELYLTDGTSIALAPVSQDGATYNPFLTNLIDLLLANAVAPIVWTASSDFNLGYASLNASLQLGGDPVFG